MLEDKLRKIDDLKEILNKLRPFDKQMKAKVDQIFRLWWNYHSNAIEGNQLTLGETRSLILHGLTAKGKPIKDHTDIEGHNKVLLLLEGIIKEERNVTQNLIRELHEALLVKPYRVNALTPEGNSTEKLIELGKYKTSSNNVKTSTGEIHYYASPEETPSKMTDLIDWYNNALKGQVHPVLISAEFHYKFVSIHPFDDGNGRMARILMNLILMREGFVPAILRREARNEYIMALEEGDQGNRDTFYDYIVSCELDSIQKYVEGIQGEDINEDDDVDKRLALLDRKLKGMAEDEDELGYDYVRWGEEVLLTIDKEIVVKFSEYFKQTKRFIKYNAEKVECDGVNKLYDEFRKAYYDGTRDFDIEIKFIHFNRKSVKPFDLIRPISFRFSDDNPQILYSNNSKKIDIGKEGYNEAIKTLIKIEKEEILKIIEDKIGG